MEPMPRLTLANHCASLDAPRIERTKRHPLHSIVVMAICAVIGGAESWDDIELFGESKADWFASFLDLPHGIPSHDTFNRVFAARGTLWVPVQFQTCFQHWMQAVAGVLPAQVIALDGKTVRGSQDRVNGQQAIHMVSAWASANHLVLAQMKVDQNTQGVPDEITALPVLLGQLAITGCVVTIDAMGCQREIAQQILDQGGDYVLGLKGNQETLHQEVQHSFTLAQQDGGAGVSQAERVEKGHGRIETRRA